MVEVTAGSKRYVFTQATAPSGIGEVAGSLWYETGSKILYTYDGSAWNAVSQGEGMSPIVWFPYGGGYTVIQGTWASQSDANFWFGHRAHNATGTAQNDEITFKAYLETGTYVADLIFLRNTGKGIASIQVGGVTKATIDLYGANASNVVGTSGTFAITSSGLVDLGIKMATKNGSSSNYQINFSALILRRTA